MNTPATLNDAVNAIREWLVICKNKELIRSVIGKHSSYFQTDTPINEDMHMYPGIIAGELYMFLIPAAQDKADFIDTRAIQKYSLKKGDASGPTAITDKEASKRIALWEDKWEVWLNDVTYTEGVFQAFYVPKPTKDISQPISGFTIFLSLTQNEMQRYKAGLVLGNISVTSQVYYFDTVRLVPPFKPKHHPPLVSETFHLLELAKRIGS
ncbi:MAG: hypothetical protein ACT6QS_14185 [Flavobacteriales bacterium]